jgi:hypothetical protein
MVLKNCDQWLAAGYFTWHDALPAKGKNTATGQPGIADKQWKALDKIVKNEA